MKLWACGLRRTEYFSASWCCPIGSQPYWSVTAGRGYRVRWQNPCFPRSSGSSRENFEPSG